MTAVAPQAAPGLGVAEQLLPALERLDARLAAAVEHAESVHLRARGGQHFGGAHIELAEVAELLTRRPGEARYAPGWSDAEIESLAELEAAFGLDAFDLDVLLVAAAPDLDRRYERIYAYLQDDQTRPRPTVDLALDLLCSDAADRLHRRARFAADAPLRAASLIELGATPVRGVPPPLLMQALRCDEQVVRLLTGDPGIDDRIATFAAFATLPSTPPAHDLEAVRALIEPVAAGGPVRLAFEGAIGSGRRSAAAALAYAAGRPLLNADVSHPDARATAALRVLVREAAWRGAVLSLSGIDALRETPDDGDLRRLLDALSKAPGTAVLHCDRRWRPSPVAADVAPLGVQRVPFGPLDAAGRRARWQLALSDVGAQASDATLDAVAARFRLTQSQIHEAVAEARGPRRGGVGVELSAATLMDAARSQTAGALGELATHVRPRWSWDDLVLPDEPTQQLRELCQRVTHREVVMNGWGLGAQSSAGVAAVFAGPPGTGKTMAAEVIAAELGVDLCRVDLARVVSKWIGETEKNLGRIFDAAAHANAVLLFDEAEALFGKRSEVKDAHDRYANIEVSYLLQRLEAHDGICILTTNLPGSMDDAFIRRLTALIRFSPPDEAERERMWARVWPAAVPVDPHLDRAQLAQEYELTGAEIHNVAVAAAFAAAEAGTNVTSDLIRHAVVREWGKTGRTIQGSLA